MTFLRRLMPYGLIFCCTLPVGNTTSAISCDENGIPTAVSQLSNLKMVAPSSIDLSAAPVFSGSKFIFSISALVTDPANVVMINRRNGIVRINAATEDEFEVTIQATNPCGAASTKFTVQITSKPDL